MKLQSVHLRVNDAATQKPTPCRIRITDPSGQEYAPFGRTLNFSTNRGEDVGGHVKLGRERWFTIDGACEIALPPSELRVQVRKGIEYEPIDSVVSQSAGKMAMRLTVQRGIIVDAEMWDYRCHDSTPHAMVVDAAAEGLDVVQALAQPVHYLGADGNSYERVPNVAALSGQNAAYEAHGAKVIVNTHNRHPILGSLSLLNCHRTVYPLSFGGSDSSDDWSLQDWANQCHRKNGFVVWTDPFSPRQPHAGEALALAILGQIDAYEVTPDNFGTAIRPWYQLLNAGVHLRLVGASARISNDRPLGSMRTTVVDEELVWHIPHVGVCVSNGPAVSLIQFDDLGVALAESLVPFSRFDVIHNGKVVATGIPEKSDSRPGVTKAEINWKALEPGWVAARAVGEARSLLDDRTPVFAHTSAQWIGEPRRDPAAVAFLQGHLDRLRDWIENVGRFENPKSKQHLLDTVAAATAKLT